jgi:hypothetical protein
MPRPSHSSRFYHPHNSGWSVQIMKLLNMKLSNKLQAKKQTPCNIFSPPSSSKPHSVTTISKPCVQQLTNTHLSQPLNDFTYLNAWEQNTVLHFRNSHSSFLA